MENLPIYISAVFMLTTIITVVIFYRSSNNSKATLFILFGWLTMQSCISLTGFYKVTNTVPPRFLLLVLPPVVLIIVLFLTPKGRKYIAGFNIKVLTLLHIARVPVELVLFWLFIQKAVPKIMTFEGRNFDILSGITAPFIFYFGFVKKQLSKRIILLWNFICLALLLNIVVLAILSAPFPFQQFGLSQPNIAVLYFPFIWLPCCIVPLVMFSHLVAIRRCLSSQPL